MGHLGMSLSRNGLIIISLVLVAGAGTAYAGLILPTITLSGNVVVTDDLTVDTDILVVDSTNDRVGIGTTSPTSKLHVVGDLTLQSEIICDNCIDSADILDCDKEAALTRAVPTFVSSPQCGSLNVETVESSTSAVSTSMVVGQDGFPVMSYIDFPNDQLRFIHCTKQDCSTFDSRIIVENVMGFQSSGTATAIGTDGFPAISYWDGTSDDLMFVHCTSQDCLTNDTPLVLDSAGNVGQFLSMAIGTDDFPVISYFDQDTPALKFVHCKAVNCQAGNPDRPCWVYLQRQDFAALVRPRLLFRASAGGR